MKKALIVGYGSIGTRHAKNLLSIGNMKILILTKRKNLEINQKKEKIRLGIKQLTKDPFEFWMNKN